MTYPRHFYVIYDRGKFRLFSNIIYKSVSRNALRNKIANEPEFEVVRTNETENLDHRYFLEQKFQFYSDAKMIADRMNKVGSVLNE